MNPQIKIKFNKFLSPIFTDWIHQHDKWKNWKEPTQGEIDTKVKLFNAVWDKKGDEILTKMQKFTGLNFKRNIIDVHIVAGNPRAFNFPIVLKSNLTEDEFITILTHELTHTLQSDNDVDYISYWKSKYPKETNTTLNHIVTYAALRHIFKGSMTLLKIKKEADNHSTNEYTRAWEIVVKEGYGEIAKQLRILRHSISVV